jgi:hypothetical protein
VSAELLAKTCPASCPCRHSQSAGVQAWLGPDGSRRATVEVEPPPDIRVVYLKPEQLARSRWFKHTTEVS